MLISCKISHSVLTYLDRQGADLGPFFESGEFPAEFVRDASYWLEAPLMEALLQALERQFGDQLEGALPALAGHAGRELRSWGVLDSVLRMVGHVKDLYSQPERFIGYFVSPAPPIGNVVRGPDSVAFDLPLDASQYPSTFLYLKASLEALPTYMDKPHARVDWVGPRIAISWQEEQESLLSEASRGERQIHPELIESVMQNLHTVQKELEAAKRSLREKDAEVLELRGRLAQAGHGVKTIKRKSKGFELDLRQAESVATMPVLAQSLSVPDLVQRLCRLQDYLARGQQLITLLVGQGRSTPQVQEAMRRVDWPYVQMESPRLVRDLITALQSNSEPAEPEPAAAVAAEPKTTAANALPPLH